MSNLTSTLSTVAGGLVVRDASIGATADTNVFPGGCTLFEVSLDNSANAAQTEYLKIYNSAAPTVGTTVPEYIVPVAGGATLNLAIPEGTAFATAVSVACVTTGGTGGTTNPTSSVVLAMTLGS